MALVVDLVPFLDSAKDVVGGAEMGDLGLL